MLDKNKQVLCHQCSNALYKYPIDRAVRSVASTYSEHDWASTSQRLVPVEIITYVTLCEARGEVRSTLLGFLSVCSMDSLLWECPGANILPSSMFWQTTLRYYYLILTPRVVSLERSIVLVETNLSFDKRASCSIYTWAFFAMPWEIEREKRCLDLGAFSERTLR